MSEAISTETISVNRAILDLVVPVNSSLVPIAFDVFLNNVAIGSFTVPAGQPGPIHHEFDFGPIAGPNYTVRLTETTQVPGGQGSLTIGYTGPDAGTVELVPSLSTYACRQVKDQSEPKFAKILDLPVTDDLGAELVDVQKPFQICNPSDQDGAGVAHPDAILCCYKMKASKLKPAVPLTVSDGFGTHELDVSTAKTICQPCTIAP